MLHKPFARTLWVVFLMSALAKAQAQPQSRYPLRQLIAVGDRSLTESASETSLKLTARSGDQEAPPIEATTRFRERSVEAVLATRGSTISKLREQYLAAGTVSTDPHGNQMTEPSSLQGKTFTIERKGTGIVITPATAKMSAEDRQQLSRALEQVRIPLLPDRDAAIGEEWTVTTAQIRIFFPQARAGTMKARFQEVTAYEGRQCAHIHLTGELQLGIPGLPAPVKAELTGDLYEALDIRRPVAVEFSGPLTMSAQTQQGDRVIALSGAGRMQAKVSIQWQKVAGKPVLPPKAAPGAASQPAAAAMVGSVRYGEIGVQLPGPGWKVLRYNREAQRLELGLPGKGRMRGVSIWPFDVPAGARDRSQKEQAAAYFAGERRTERPDGPWTAFKEGERVIGGQRYATMSFQFHPNVSAEHVMDGLFLVYFPPDFEKRQRSYVLMWSDLHPKGENPHGLEELDAVVRTLQVTGS